MSGSVPGKTRLLNVDVEVRHLLRVGSARARFDGPFAEQQGEVAVDRRIGALARVDDEQAHEAHPHLSHFVEVRVVHVRAVLP